jgi:hypothetical protein
VCFFPHTRAQSGGEYLSGQAVLSDKKLSAEEMSIYDDSNLNLIQGLKRSC